MSVLRRVRVRVPASTSNLGPGFDCLGMALGLYNDLVVEMHSEDDILESFGHEEVKNDQGKVIKAANQDCFPVEYEKLFKQPSAADIRTRYNLGAAPAGSRAARKDEWGDQSGAEAPPARRGITSRAGTRPAGGQSSDPPFETGEQGNAGQEGDDIPY